MLIAIIIVAVVAAVAAAGFVLRLRGGDRASTSSSEQSWDGTLKLMAPRERRAAERRALERRVRIGAITEERRDGADRRAAARRDADAASVSEQAPAPAADRRRAS